MLDEFLGLHPAVELQLSVSDSMLDVYKDEVDLTLRYGPLADSNLVARRLTAVRRLAVASPDYLRRCGRPAHPDELAGHECLTFKIRNRNEREWRFFPRSEPGAVARVVMVRGRRSTDDGHVAHEWALRGLGMVYKSALDIRDSLASGALVSVFDDWVGDALPLHAVMPSQRFMPQRVRALVDFLALRLGGAEGAAPAGSGTSGTGAGAGVSGLS